MISRYAKLVEMLTRNFIKAMRRQPNNLENLKIKQQAGEIITQEKKIIPFRYKKTFGEEIKEMEEKGVGSLFKKTAETEDEILARLNKQNRDTIEKIKSRKQKTAEEMIDEGDYDPSGFAGGGRVLKSLVEAINKKFGKGALTTADNIARPDSAITRDLFKRMSNKLKNKPSKKGEFIEDGETPDYEYYKELLDDAEDSRGFNVQGDETIEVLEDRLKKLKDEEAYWYGQYKTGKLDPRPGEVNRSRLDFLRKKAQEAEMSGDSRLISRDELYELDELEKRFEYLDLEDKAQNLSRKMTDKEIQKLKEINDSGYVDFQKEMDRITRTKKAEGGLTSIINSGLDEEEDLALNIGAGRATSGIINAAKKYGPSIASFIFSGGLSGPAEAMRAGAKQVAASKVADSLSQKVLENLTQQAARENQSANTGGYQSSWGGVSDFMSGSGTSADMGSFKKGGSVKKSIREKIIDFVGGPSAAAAELGLEGILQIYDLLGMPLFAKGGLAKNKLTDTVPPEKGPDSQGVESLFRRK